MFSKKLDFLMNITKTTNSALAHYISLDASYISRLRSGKRKLPKNQNYVKKMVSYFIKQLNSQQIENLKSILTNINYMGYKNLSLDQLLYSWLTDDGESTLDADKIFTEFSIGQVKKISTIDKNHFLFFNEDIGCPENFYGFDGLRKAVIKFLLYIIDSPTPETLYLFSDEDMSWLGDDKAFFHEWMNLMSEVIKNGNKIKIIHTVNRNLDEMITAIKGWMPLYMTGAIESYYYPKKRDGIFKRTLFVVPKSVALVATSVGDMKDTIPINLIFDKKAIDSFYEEYNNLLSICKPLIKIFDSKDKWKYYHALEEFEAEKADTIIQLDSLSVFTMPNRLRYNLINRITHPNSHILINYYKTRILNFEKTLEKSKYIEIIKLPNLNEVKAGKFKIISSFMFYEETIYYTVDEFKEHLENIILLLENFENYCMFFYEGERDYMFYVKEDVGVFAASKTDSSVFIKIDENNIVSAFGDYICHELHLDKINPSYKSNTILKLRMIIDELSSFNE